MKTFEELTEVVHSINEMEQIFRNVAVIVCHQSQIQRYLDLKDRIFEILTKDIHKNEDLCSEEMTECITCDNCEGKE